MVHKALSYMIPTYPSFTWFQILPDPPSHALGADQTVPSNHARFSCPLALILMFLLLSFLVHWDPEWPVL